MQKIPDVVVKGPALAGTVGGWKTAGSLEDRELKDREFDLHPHNLLLHAMVPSFITRSAIQYTT